MIVMTKPRKAVVSLNATPYYHCVSRCVRRAFLCGNGSNGACYEHRRRWIEDKIIALTDIFSIDVCAYAVMSNHYHVVIHIDKDTADNWSDDEVINRWHQLYNGTLLTQRYVKNKAAMLQAEIETIKDGCPFSSSPIPRRCLAYPAMVYGGALIYKRLTNMDQR
jgi:hypothetical protein